MKNLRYSLIITLLTFLLAILVTLSSQSRLNYVSLGPAMIILLIIIFVGIISDMVGVAATVASEKSFNARAAKKIFGAKQGLFLVKHGDRVASLMCDIIGDICGTVSGAIGAVIVLRIVKNFGSPETLVNLIIIGMTAALTVGGKAFFKAYGIKKANEIVFFVGKLMAGLYFLKGFIFSRLRGEK